MLNSEGLLRYVDTRCIQRELSEAAGISEEEMDELAHELLNMRQDDAAAAAQPFQTRDCQTVPSRPSGHYRGCPGTCWSPHHDSAADDGNRRHVAESDVESPTASHQATTSKTRPPYYEHLGGYEMDELKDYNEYSKRRSTVVARVARRFYRLRDRGSGSGNGNGAGNGRTRIEFRHHRRKDERLEPNRQDTSTTPWAASNPGCVSDGFGASSGQVPGRSSCLAIECHRQRTQYSAFDGTDEATMYITSL